MNLCIACKAYNKCFASSLNQAEQTELGKCLKQKTVPKGEVIYRENKSAQNIFVLIEGRIIQEHQDAMIHPVIMRLIKENEFIGLEAIIPERNYIATATAYTEATFCTIPKTCIEKLLKSNMEVYKQIFSEMSRQYERVFNYSFLMLWGSSLSKLAYSLITLADEKGFVLMSKAEIARMTGLARETISRLLGKLKENNIIEINKREVKIIKPKELEKLLSKKKMN